MEYISHIEHKITTEVRPCYADGKKALFHRWVDRETAIIKFNSRAPHASINIKRVIEIFENEQILPSYCDMDKTAKTYAIVEFENGEVAEVDPTHITFADNKIKEYAF